LPIFHLSYSTVLLAGKIAFSLMYSLKKKKNPLLFKEKETPPVGVQPVSQQLGTRQPLAHPSPSPPGRWGGETDTRQNSWVEIKTH